MLAIAVVITAFKLAIVVGNRGTHMRTYFYEPAQKEITRSSICVQDGLGNNSLILSVNSSLISCVLIGGSTNPTMRLSVSKLVPVCSTIIKDLKVRIIEGCNGAGTPFRHCFSYEI
ncbi:hypothetical protein AVEN_19146-1 [Araneus ventricosus]|uniref:Uncharacterized protein n=1 Tax=Araneus ventricosus TaxID=182803 RepID=A0A4Y2S8Y0_ARAVE|nr:hypothetical protein AVEN_19146-1 [Araneus ventricosus]